MPGISINTLKKDLQHMKTEKIIVAIEKKRNGLYIEK
jgi:hypothetical protein